jgi:hypothetical protein
MLDTVAAQTAAIDDLIGRAKASIQVFDVDLSETGWTSPARCDRLAAFLRGSRHARLDIIGCDIVAEAFPSTPWVLCLRDPVEVAVSLVARPPGWMQGNTGAAAVLRRVVDPTGAPHSAAEFAARLYGSFCAAARRLDPARGRLLDYAELPGAIWGMVAPHFGLAVDDLQRARMLQEARTDAKAPLGKTKEFTGDAASKQAAATPELRAAIEQFAQPELARLRLWHGTETQGS